MWNVATCRRDDAVQEGLPIPSRTRMRPKVRWDPARSSSRRRRTTSGGRGSRSEAARVEGSCSSSEGAYVSPVGQGEATLAFRGGGMYEVSSSSQQPPHPQPRVDLGWTGPTLSFPPPAETGADAGAGAGAGGEVIPRTAEFYAMMGLHPPAP